MRGLCSVERVNTPDICACSSCFIFVSALLTTPYVLCTVSSPREDVMDV